jgi:hypothetical protein
MAHDRLKVGIIGFGAMGKMHADQIAYLDYVEIVSVVETFPDNRIAAEKYFHNQGTVVYEDLTVALEASVLDGWIVTSSTKSHIAITKQLLEYGASVLLEKPIGESLESAQSLEEGSFKVDVRSHPFVEQRIFSIQICGGAGWLTLFNELCEKSISGSSSSLPWRITNLINYGS